MWVNEKRVGRAKPGTGPQIPDTGASPSTSGGSTTKLQPSTSSLQRSPSREPVGFAAVLPGEARLSSGKTGDREAETQKPGQWLDVQPSNRRTESSQQARYHENQVCPPPGARRGGGSNTQPLHSAVRAPLLPTTMQPSPRTDSPVTTRPADIPAPTLRQNHFPSAPSCGLIGANASRRHWSALCERT
jgi:hypothetical protein